jgi:anti-sigma B factor antagonist
MTEPPPFALRSSSNGRLFVVDVSGEVDMATAPELARALDVLGPPIERVIVDLSAVDFLDSSALNTLVRSQRELADRGVEFRVVSPGDQAIRRVFEITQLTGQLGVVDDRTQAEA